MSRNPYLAATRPASSFTRSSRTSKRNDLSSGSLLGRSRSSANLASGSAYSSATGSAYSASPASSWQRSTSSSRLNRLPSSETPSSTYRDSYNQRQLDRGASSSSYDSSKPYLSKSASSHSLRKYSSAENEADAGSSSTHLQNYQKSKLQQASTRTGQLSDSSNRFSKDSSTSLDSATSTGTTTTTTTAANKSASSLDISTTADHPYSRDVDGLRSNSPSHRLLKQQPNLLKSNSLDIGKKSNEQSAPVLHGSLSLDRLLYKAESLSERELRKMFKELVVEFEQLRRQLKSTEEGESKVQQDWIRKERQLQRKISELEEENKQLEQFKQEIQRLKDENCSLIRVVSKLTKQAS